MFSIRLGCASYITLGVFICNVIVLAGLYQNYEKF